MLASLTDSKNLTHPKYRADIDGLRAFAVLSVVGFHAFPTAVPGGFVGVDIFFVISGFLISSIIFENLKKSSFSFSEFYSRRIRRIFPALLLVLLSCLAVGWFTLLADEYRQLGKHIAGGAGFISNLVLWRESGYFDLDAETKPLLHLWSLGIEEQFYIFWPLILWFLSKRSYSLGKATFIFATASLLLNVVLVHFKQIATFYTPPTRFWELLLGSMLAYLLIERRDIFHKMSLKSANLMSWSGCLLIALAILTIKSTTAFPGWWALLPTVGAVLFIAGGQDAWPNRWIFSNPVAVWFGLISFPLYLWHWPLLSFARIVEGGVPALETRVTLIGVSILLAWLTYRLFEIPLRFGSHRRGKAIGLFLLMAMTGISGFVIYKYDGLEFRDAEQTIRYEGDIGHVSFFKYMTSNYFQCSSKDLLKDAFSWEGIVECFQSHKDGPIDIAIVGDSHAEHLFIGLAEAMPGKNVLFSIKASNPYYGNDDFREIYKFVMTEKSIKKVILSAWWSRRRVDVPANSSFKAELLDTATKLAAAGKDVFIVDDVPNFSFDPKRCKYSRILSHVDNQCVEESGSFSRQYDTYIHDFEQIEKTSPRIKVVRVRQYLCGVENCSMEKDGKVLYRDNNHLNIPGSKYVGMRLLHDYPDLGI